MKVVAFGLMAGAGFQAWRNYPPDGLMTPTSAWLACCIAVGCAFVAGYRYGRPSRAAAHAVAVATATAASEASSASAATVNLAIVTPGGGASPVGLSVPQPGEVSWAGERRPLPGVDELDGMAWEDLDTLRDHDPAGDDRG